MTRQRLLICLSFASVGCTTPDPGVPYQGSCPVLIECAPTLDPDRVDEFVQAFGEDGSCWEGGSHYWTQCRSSCVTALEQLNANAAATGLTCGTCNDDAECTEFGDDARCEGGYCARPRLGEIADGAPGDGDGAVLDVDDGDITDIIEENIDPECLVDTTPSVVLDTNYGLMVFELDAATSPAATATFLVHLSANFYNNTIFHRVVDGTVIQGGGYGPGPVLKPPLWAAPILTPPSLPHVDGAIAMQFGSDPTSVESQWYITDGAQPDLDGQDVVFGALIDGFEVRDEISAVDVETISWMDYVLSDVPVDDVLIIDAFCVEQWP